jgi:hypothetical protein
MTSATTVRSTTETVAKGIFQDQTTRLRERVEPPVDEFKEDTAERIESLAEHVRKLGRQLDRRDESHAIARRLERTADYLRYRPTSEVASDAWDTVRQSKLLWVAGGAVAAFAAYRLLHARIH